jgi:uncharacterized protein
MKFLRVWVALLGVMLAAPMGAWAEKVASMPAPTGYVDDYAGVISASGKMDLEDLCKDVHDKTRAQVFFVTVKTLDGEAVEKFANELFAKWKIGEKKTDRGVLLVLAIKEHKRWIEVGYGLEGILNDAKVGDIGREMVPDLQAKEYDDAAMKGVRAISKVIAADAGVEIAGLEDTDAALVAARGDAAADADAAAAAEQPPVEIDKTSMYAAIGFVLVWFSACGAFVRWRIKMFRKDNPGAPLFGSSRSSSDSGSGGSSFGGGGDSDFGGGDGGFSGGGGAGGDW